MVKGFKKAWFLKAGVILLAAILGVFMLIPAGTLFAQNVSWAGRWEVTVTDNQTGERIPGVFDLSQDNANVTGTMTLTDRDGTIFSWSFSGTYDGIDEVSGLLDGFMPTIMFMEPDNTIVGGIVYGRNDQTGETVTASFEGRRVAAPDPAPPVVDEPGIEAPAPDPTPPAVPRPRPRPRVTICPRTPEGFVMCSYRFILGRAAEAEGRAAWLNRLNTGAVTGKDLVQRFIFGQECQERISDYSNEEFVRFLYKGVLHRDAEAESFNIWVARMAAGMSKEEMVDRFTSSEEFINLCKSFGVMPYAGYSE